MELNESFTLVSVCEKNGQFISADGSGGFEEDVIRVGLRALTQPDFSHISFWKVPGDVRPHGPLLLSTEDVGSMGQAPGHASARPAGCRLTGVPDLAGVLLTAEHARDHLTIVFTNIFRNKKDFIFNQISSGSQGLGQNHKPVSVWKETWLDFH